MKQRVNRRISNPGTLQSVDERDEGVLLTILAVVIWVIVFLLEAGCVYSDSHVSDWAEKHPELLRHQFEYED
jgi:hypothetical protein